MTMLGKNTLELNVSTMKTIVQYYFDNVMFRPGQGPKVEGVVNGTRGGGEIFVIKLEEHTAANAIVDPSPLMVGLDVDEPEIEP
jgi:hypothetical protein